MSQGVSPDQAAAWLLQGHPNPPSPPGNPQWLGYKQYQDIFDAAVPNQDTIVPNPEFYNDWVTPRGVPDPQGIHRPVLAF